MSRDHVIDLSERRERSETELDDRLRRAYRDAKAADDGRRVSLRELPRAERKRL